MIRTVTALTAIALFGSAAAAADKRHDERNYAAKRHSACTLAAARKLAWKRGSPQALAYEVLRSCKAEEDALAKFLPLGALDRLRSNAVRERAETISAIRESGAPSPNRSSARRAVCVRRGTRS